ncbi:MAG: Ig-like domain-containing protein [Proteobacteria bacterium]|nr:Ig-like domain-containing protein [Pseudomonadota bacterium]
MRMRSVAFIAAIFAAGCGGVGWEPYESLVRLQPFVVSVSPADLDVVSACAPVEIEFSRAVSIDTVNPSSLAVLMDDSEEIDGVVSDLDRGKASGMEGLYEFSSDGRVAVFRPAQGYEPGARYMILATGAIQSEEGLPLNQSAGRSPTPFVSRFSVEWFDGEASASGGGSGAAGTSTPVKERPSYIVINEILYDAAGSDTEGDVFVELRGEAGKEISDYMIELVNGADGASVKSIRLPEGARLSDQGIYVVADAITGQPGVSNVAAADFILNFDPQNGPDCVQLLDEAGSLLDALGYGEPLPETAANGLECYLGAPAIDVNPGQSLSRTDGIDTRDNSQDFKAIDDPTPGMP